MSPAEMKFKLTVLDLVRDGIYPGPVQIRRALGRDDGSQSINGRETRWRREALLLLGWKERRLPHKHRYSFIPPSTWKGEYR